MKRQLVHTYNEIISLENLGAAWQEFVVGKKRKPDVLLFGRHLIDNILALHDELVKGTYRHGGYYSFYVTDPKRRHIHKASVRDRLLHHAVHRMLYPFFDRTFIADSFSCRQKKGVHRAINRFKALSFQVSKNHTRTAWVLKCDIRKFFASIDQKILLHILNQSIPDQKIINLLHIILSSFQTEGTPGVGLPLGNLTSQLLANIYMNEFDQWVKHQLKPPAYVRYADDFVFLSTDKQWLEILIPRLENWLAEKLHLTLHPHKVFLKTLASGVDFLGWVHFPRHRVMRTRTKKRMLARIKFSPTKETLQSYLGLLSHGNTRTLQKQIIGDHWLWRP